jgi:hypothetical protein
MIRLFALGVFLAGCSSNPISNRPVNSSENLTPAPPPSLQLTLQALERLLADFSPTFVLRTRATDPEVYSLSIEIRKLEDVETATSLANSILKGNRLVRLRSVGAGIAVQGLEEFWHKMEFLKGGALLSSRIEEILELPNRPKDLDRLWLSIGDAGVSIIFGSRSAREEALQTYREMSLKMPTLEVYGEQDWWIQKVYDSETSNAFRQWQSNATRTYDRYIRDSFDSYSIAVQRWTEQWMGLMARLALEKNSEKLRELEKSNPEFIYFIGPVDRPESEMFYYNIQTLGLDGGLKLYDEFFGTDA